MSKYPEYKQLNLAQIGQEVLEEWKAKALLKRVCPQEKESRLLPFMKASFSKWYARYSPCYGAYNQRYILSLQNLTRIPSTPKAGWDTHGLPVELGVEKELGITKEDIGKNISIAEYNQKCRENVMKFKGVWENLTDQMGYWVDMNDPYVTYDNKYIESVWWLLSQIHDKGMLYKGHTIQPYSPKAGTGLSSHELNQPGCYREVKDVTAIAQFKVVKNEQSDFIFEKVDGDLFLLAWTTTPWTLPSNTALAVGKKIEYVKVKTFNQYTHQPITVVLAKDLFTKFFPEKNADLKLTDYVDGDKNIPFEIIGSVKGSELEGVFYEQLLTYAQPEDGDAFRVLIGDFVTTEDGTGIVHLAPSFGADDNRVAKQNGIGSLTLVDTQGRFVDSVSDFAGMYVKDEYYTEGDEKPELPVDVQIVVKLKESNLCFKAEKYEHSYPHCWRTDKPILYYPLESWFVKTTAAKERW